jgi:hypothetical protein
MRTPISVSLVPVPEMSTSQGCVRMCPPSNFRPRQRQIYRACDVPHSRSSRYPLGYCFDLRS